MICGGGEMAMGHNIHTRRRLSNDFKLQGLEVAHTAFTSSYWLELSGIAACSCIGGKEIVGLSGQLCIQL